MSEYLIAITPAPSENASAGGQAQVIIRVQTAGTRSRITEMTVKFDSPNGLSSADLPGIDLDGIVVALAAAVRPSSLVQGFSFSTDGEPAVVASEFARRAPEKPKVPLAKRQAADTVAEGRKGERAYRRMPAAEELLAVYERVGTVIGLGHHYGVPRHTAQGWIGRARKKAGASSTPVESIE